MIEREVINNDLDKIDKKEWKNSFEYKVHLENILTSRSVNILENLDEIQQLFKNLIEIRIDLK